MNSLLRPIPFSALSRQIDDMFGEMVRTSSAPALAPVNVAEDEKNFYVELEAPGYTEDQLDVSVHENVLTVKGERSSQTEQREVNYVRRERTEGSFSRSFRLVTEIDEDKISATLKNGVLFLTLPKAPAAQKRRISVAPGN